MLFESIVIALQALWANKLRLILTMVGIVIGVGAVIVMVSLGTAVKMEAEKFYSTLGVNTLKVYGFSNIPGVKSKVSFSDANVIAHQIPGVKQVVPEPSYAVNVDYGNNNWSKTAVGTLPEYLEAHNMDITHGRFIGDADLSNKNKVVVLGKEPTKILFGNNDPIGQLVRINNIYFRVIGVCSSPVEGMSNLNEIMIIPLSTAREYFAARNDEYLQEMQIKADDKEAVKNVEKAVTELLRARHAIRLGKKDDFMIQNSAAMLQKMDEQLRNLTLFLASIAALSLFVGGIGIMNIMLISVTQRTREIGIRKALGATYSNILLQFLIEALVISAIGSGLGVICGFGVTFLAESLMKLPNTLSINATICAVSTAMLIGLFFGLWPAHRAALLDPVEALRYER